MRSDASMSSSAFEGRVEIAYGAVGLGHVTSISEEGKNKKGCISALWSSLEILCFSKDSSSEDSASA